MALKLGLALDVGTTSVSLMLVSLSTQKTLATSSLLNPQRRFGADVLRRIGACENNPRARLAMRDELFCAIGATSELLCLKNGLSPADITLISFCANPAVTYLSLGLDASPLGTYPYEAPLKFGTLHAVKELQLPLSVSDSAQIYIAPLSHGFIGSDALLGFCMACEETEGSLLYADLGTNTELLLRTPDGVFCASAAAGPAFEGGEVACGMPAIPGAIDHISYESGAFSYTVLGEDPSSARGICGSALLDLLFCLSKAGFATNNGTLKHPLCLTPDITVSTSDVRALLLAKAAIRAGIDALLTEAHLLPSMLDTFVLTGVFGASLSPKSAINAGLFDASLPLPPRQKNDLALCGARDALWDGTLRERAKALSESALHLDLACCESYKEFFLQAANLKKEAE